jgi:hypothetical protein
MKSKLIDDWKTKQILLLADYPLPKLPPENFIFIILLFLVHILAGLILAFFGLFILLFTPANLNEGLFTMKSGFLLWTKPAKLPRAAAKFYKQNLFLESARCFAEVYSFPYRKRLEPKYKVAYKLVSDEKAIDIIPDQLLSTLKGLLFVNMWLDLYFGENNYTPDNENKYNTELSKIASEREDFLNLITVIDKYLASINNYPGVEGIRNHLVKVLSECPKCLDLLHKGSISLNENEKSS